MSKTTKILLILLAVIIFIGILTIVLINLSNRSHTKGTTIDDNLLNEVNEPEDSITKIIPDKQAQYEEMLENKDFIQAYKNFQYPEAKLIDAGLIDDNGVLFYIVFESEENFEKIDYFYKNKKVQSIWNRTEIFETFNKNVEENFKKNNNEEILEQELEDLKFTKYSFIAQNKDRYLNILIKSLPDRSTRIMLVSWDLDI